MIISKYPMQGRLGSLSISPIICSILILTACNENSENKNIADRHLIMKAIKENRKFHIDINKNKKSGIDLSYLDSKFPDMEVCHHHGYSTYPKSKKVKNKESINLNKPLDRLGKESKSIYFIYDDYYFIFHHYDEFINNLSFKVSYLNKKDNYDWQCMKAKDIVLPIDKY